MKLTSPLAAALVAAAWTAVAPAADLRDPETWRASIRHSLDFFQQHAWDEAGGSYATNLAVDGARLDETRHLVAASRMLYGLAHGADADPAYLDQARRYARFFTRAFVGRDADGPYFVKAVDAAGEAVDDPDSLAVNEQAYGLNGLVALYQRTQDPAVLELVRGAHDAFVTRFYDPEHGGFFDGFDRARRQPARTKSYNSTVYVATAYLLELAEADPARRDQYLPLLRELGDVVEAHFLDASTGWIVENFTADWRPDWRGWQAQAEGSIGVVGHNFQAAWMLLRLAALEGVDAARAGRYDAAARVILASMLAKPVHDAELGGLHDVFVRETDEPMWHTNKPWWQQAEGILALTLAARRGVLRSREALAVRDGIVEFYFEHFLDRERGGEYAVVTREGAPAEDGRKGNPGKSTYHTVELARYLLAYTRP